MHTVLLADGVVFPIMLLEAAKRLHFLYCEDGIESELHQQWNLYCEYHHLPYVVCAPNATDGTLYDVALDCQTVERTYRLSTVTLTQLEFLHKYSTPYAQRQDFRRAGETETLQLPGVAEIYPAVAIRRKAQLPVAITLAKAYAFLARRDLRERHRD